MKLIKAAREALEPLLNSAVRICLSASASVLSRQAAEDRHNAI